MEKRLERRSGWLCRGALGKLSLGRSSSDVTARLRELARRRRRREDKKAKDGGKKFSYSKHVNSLNCCGNKVLAVGIPFIFYSRIRLLLACISATDSVAFSTSEAFFVVLSCVCWFFSSDVEAAVHTASRIQLQDGRVWEIKLYLQ